MDETFVTEKISVIDFYYKGCEIAGIKYEDIQFINGTASVHWGVEFDFRNWGIKDINLSIQKVEVVGEIEYYDAEDLECETMLCKDFNVSDFEIVNELEMSKSFSQPNEIEVDFKTKKITVK